MVGNLKTISSRTARHKNGILIWSEEFFLPSAKFPLPRDFQPQTGAFNEFME